MVAVPTGPELYVHPEHVPANGVYVSSNARMIILGGDGVEYEVIRANRAVIRWNNNARLYLQTSKQTGFPYVGLFDVSGSFSRAHVNFAEARLLAGHKPPIGSKSISELQLGDTGNGNFRTGGRLDVSRYPLRNTIFETEIDSNAIDFGPVKARVHLPLLSNNQVSFDANNIIRSGPMDYIGSWMSLQKITA